MSDENKKSYIESLDVDDKLSKIMEPASEEEVVADSKSKSKRPRGRPTKEESDRVAEEKMAETIGAEEMASGDITVRGIPKNFDMDKFKNLLWQMMARDMIKRAKSMKPLDPKEHYMVLQTFNSIKDMKLDSRKVNKLNEILNKEAQTPDDIYRVIQVLNEKKTISKN